MSAEPDTILRAAAARPSTDLDWGELCAAHRRRRVRQRRRGFSVVALVLVVAVGALAPLVTGPGGPVVADSAGDEAHVLDAPATLATGDSWDVIAHVDPTLRLELREGRLRHLDMGGSVATGALEGTPSFDDAMVVAPSDGGQRVVVGPVPEGSTGVELIVDGTVLPARVATVEGWTVFAAVLDRERPLDALVARDAHGVEVQRRVFDDIAP